MGSVSALDFSFLAFLASSGVFDLPVIFSSWEDVSDALAIGAYSPELLLEDIRAFAQIVVAKDMSLIRG